MMMEVLDKFNKLFPVFGKNSGPLAKQIVDRSTYKAFGAGTQFYTQGDACPGIAFLLAGEIRVFMLGESGREITLYYILPGETCVLNASCILAQCPYMANATAIEDGSVLYLHRNVFLQLMSESEQMRYFIFSFFSQRFAEIIELVEEVTFGKLDVRLADYIVERAEDNVLNTTHQLIANELGSSREVISRLLKDFERKGMVELSRHYIRVKAL